MILQDFHTHTYYSDGKASPREMIEAAIQKGLTAYGISDHAYTDFDGSWCMPKGKIDAYKKELRSLQKEYKSRIDFRVGLEQDLFASPPDPDYDYVIASLHYIKVNGEYITIDESAETLKRGAEKHLGGDMYALCDLYYKTLAKYAEDPFKYAFIGHLDLVTKFNENYELFNEEDPRYLNSAKACIDKLLTLNIPFEINTGAISRGYRKSPYPRTILMEYIKSRGGSFILSSDAHSPENICYKFSELNLQNL